MGPKEIEQASVELDQMKYAAQHRGEQLVFRPMRAQEWVDKYAQRLINNLIECDEETRLFIKCQKCGHINPVQQNVGAFFSLTPVVE